jgi:energy-coupling factor transporter ATP-binding protein EcfA2
VIARENPFHTERLDALAFRFLEGDWEQLWRRLETLKRATLVGPCGSGKTTLLHELARRLPARGLRPHLIVAPERPPALGATDVLLIDGGERLSRRAWPSAAFVVVTQHRPGPLPTLLDTRTTPALLAELVEHLLPGHALQSEVGTLFARSGGDLRQALLALYDRFAANAAAKPNSP